MARDLLGKMMVRRFWPSQNDKCKEIRGVITETEAYLGEHDLASHARFGKTKRTKAMYGNPGTVYMFFTYGVHWMLNIVCARRGDPQAVLIRGVRIIGEAGEEENISGPGRLTKCLQLDGSFYGENLETSNRLWVDRRHDSWRPPGPRIAGGEISRFWVLATTAAAVFALSYVPSVPGPYGEPLMRRLVVGALGAFLCLAVWRTDFTRAIWRLRTATHVVRRWLIHQFKHPWVTSEDDIEPVDTAAAAEYVGATTSKERPGLWTAEIWPQIKYEIELKVQFPPENIGVLGPCARCGTVPSSVRVTHRFHWGHTAVLECRVPNTPALQCACGISFEDEAAWPLKDAARSVRRVFEFDAQDARKRLQPICSDDDLDKLASFAALLRERRGSPQRGDAAIPGPAFAAVRATRQ